MSQPRESLRRKRTARLAAVQGIYSYEVSERKPSAEKLKAAMMQQWRDSVDGRDEEWPSDDLPEKALMETLIEGVIESIDVIDGTLANVIKDNWKPERIDSVMRAILRCAAFELHAYPDRRAAMIVDEYVSIATGFFEEGELAFTNSALHQLVSQLRADEPQA